MTEETLFAAALEKETPAGRAAFLDEACAGDPELRRRIEALLESHEQAEFLRTPAIQQAAEALGGMPTDGVSETESASEHEPALEFLGPSDEPGSLGRLGHYEVREVIGRGGMGVVLRAFDERLHRVVAIKVMAAELATSAAARRRFAREARAAAAVSHDHIVTSYAVEDAGGLPYLVMQYVAGVSLQERIDRNGPLQLPEILRVGMQTASGLAAAHAQGLIHRDIKPANILLENNVERVKITDFGLARAVDDASVTQSGVVAGTPQYMAPEQARGEVLDHRADLFSLGSVLYAMSTGRAPFRAIGTMAVLKRVCEDMPGPIREVNPEVPDWLVAIITKLHAKDPADRYQTAAEVAEVLGQHLAHVQHPSVVPLPAAEKPARPMPSRRPSRRPLVAAVLLCLIGGFGLSEGTGVTQLATTVIRVLTPAGTLVIEANDPAVNVTIEGDGGLVISETGQRQVRLRPGSYQVHATKDGRPLRLDRDLVTITRFGRQVVRVRLEDNSATATGEAMRKAFVVLGGRGLAERRFDTLSEAILKTTDGDTVEVRGNGPYLIAPFEFKHALTIRAGAGHRPVITADPQSEVRFGDVVVAHGPLRLEGLEFRCSSKPLRLLHALGPLWVANCRFQVQSRGLIAVGCEKACVVRNCVLSSARGAPLAIRCDSDAASDVANCILVGHINLDEFDLTRGATVRFTGNTFVSPHTAAFFYALHPMEMPPEPIRNHSGTSVRVVMTENALASRNTIFSLGQDDEFEPWLDAGGMEAWISRRVKWSDRRNVYPRIKSYMAGYIVVPGKKIEEIRHSGGKDFAGWNRFWGLKDTGSSEGIIRFFGGDLQMKTVTEVEELSPEDFRLRPDSAGYRAGPDGKDLGADVHLIGPGPAYERWKTMPEYQQWLEGTRPMRGSRGKS